MKFVSHLPEMAKLSVKANVGLLLDYDNWAEWCAQTRQRNCTRAGDLQLCQGHDAESGLCQFADVGEWCRNCYEACFPRSHELGQLSPRERKNPILGLHQSAPTAKSQRVSIGPCDYRLIIMHYSDKWIAVYHCLHVFIVVTRTALN